LAPIFSSRVSHIPKKTTRLESLLRKPDRLRILRTRIANTTNQFSIDQPKTEYNDLLEGKLIGLGVPENALVRWHDPGESIRTIKSKPRQSLRYSN
jgi:hypothetical protein